MRRIPNILYIVLVILGLSASAQAQQFSWNIGIDSALRLGVLFGQEGARIQDVPGSFTNSYRVDYAPRLPVATALVEISPHPVLSARIAGVTSFLEGGVGSFHGTSATAPAQSPWDVKPDFKSWEAAGLVHICSGDGYRFSFVSGYRQQGTNYVGDPSGVQAAGSSLRDEFRSYVPFIGFQTAVFHPWWKARLEILGSVFTNTRCYSLIKDGADAVEYDGKADKGGLIEVELGGTAALSQSVRMGLYGRYTYQDLHGRSTRTLSGVNANYDLSIDQAFGVVAFDFTVVY
ncbi:MAG: hypothetical protein V2B18_02970 [Pseudomonadota bacterium]